MRLFHQMREWQNVRRTLPNDLSLGFVPTMGNLHRGHASLFQKSQQEHDATVVSIFVNRAQFNQPTDYTHYPRTLEDDLTLLEQQGVTYCLLPEETDIYPDSYRYQIQETEQSLHLEGHYRPGHFTGVLTVVMKLLHLTKPHSIYFGEKDYQQFQLIRDMARAFLMDVDVKACPTIREASGLAYSSRNNRLTPAQKKLADLFAARFHQPMKSCQDITTELNALGIHVEYLEDYNERRFVSVMIGDIRLIDNYAI